MGMTHGSMRHTLNGRKKKTNYWKRTRKAPVPFVEMKNVMPVNYRETPYYPSVDPSTVFKRSIEGLTKEERLEISSSYTVAPAYNKGAYQVISKENIEHIGK